MNNVYSHALPKDLYNKLTAILKDIPLNEVNSFEDLQSKEQKDNFFLIFLSGNDENFSLKALRENYPKASIFYFFKDTLSEELSSINSYFFPENLDDYHSNLLSLLFNEDLKIDNLDELALMARDYRASITLKIKTIQDLAEAYLKDSSETNHDNLRKVIHKLAGSAGMYGFGKVSSLCKEIEHNYDQAKESNSTFSKDDVENQIKQIKEAFLEISEVKTEDKKPNVEKVSEAVSQRQDSSNQFFTLDLYIIDDDENILKVLEAEAKQAGLNVQIENSFENAKKTLGDPEFYPAAILFDLYSETEEITGHDLIQIYKESKKSSTGSFLAILSAKGELEERQKADEVIDMYIEKPISAKTLIGQIQKITRIERSRHSKVMMIDDDEDLCKMVKTLLPQESFTFDYRVNTSSIFKDLEIFEPDLVLLDIGLPDINGLDLLKSFRSDYRFRKLNVVILSANEERATLKKSFELGVTDYISKPIDQNTFPQTLQTLLNKQLSHNLLYEKEEGSDAYTKSALIQYFNSYRINYKSLGILIFKFEYPQENPLDRKILLKVLSHVANFFSKKDILGHWDRNLFVLMAVQLGTKQLALVVENLFRELQDSQYFDNQQIGLKGYLANYPTCGQSLEEIVKGANQHFQENKASALWSYFTCPKSTNLERTDAINLLVITSDDILYNLVAYAFQLRGYNTEQKKSGEEGYKHLSEVFIKSPPDLILLDESLKDEDHIIYLQKIKTIIGERIPIILLSSKTREQDIIEGLSTGATSYVTKPFSISLLIQRMEQRLA